MLRTNVNHLVKISVVGEIASPILGRPPYRIYADGRPLVLPGVGGITYNISNGKIVSKINSKANIAIMLNLRKAV